MCAKKISLQIRKLVVADHNQGLFNREIARKFTISEAAVRNIIKKFQDTGYVMDKTGRGQKRKTKDTEDRRIIREVNRSPTISSRKIKENIHETVFTRSIPRLLPKTDLRNSFAQRRPLIRNINKQKRLAFAKKYVNMLLEFWKKVVWSDESKFEIFGTKNRPRV